MWAARGEYHQQGLKSLACEKSRNKRVWELAGLQWHHLGVTEYRGDAIASQPAPTFVSSDH
jgi:hypothetical protein